MENEDDDFKPPEKKENSIQEENEVMSKANFNDKDQENE